MTEPWGRGPLALSIELFSHVGCLQLSLIAEQLDVCVIRSRTTINVYDPIPHGSVMC